MTHRNPFLNVAGAGLASVALLGTLAAQDRPDPSPVSGPVVGFISDQNAGIRPILGVPGAATLGQPVLRSTVLRGVVFSSVRDYGLALRPRGGQAVILRELNASAEVADLPVAPGAARVATSPSGDAAVLYYPEPQAVSVITGLPDAPAVAWSLETPYLAGGLGALAVSDEGKSVLISAAAEQSPVWLLAPAAVARVVSHVAASPSLAFLPRSSGAVVGDGGNGTVTLVRDPGGKSETLQIGGPAEGLSRPIAVAVSADSQRVLVANAEPAGVVSLSLAGEGTSTLPCDCAVTGLEPLAGGLTFRLSDPARRPLWLLDAASSPIRLVFVPEPSPDPPPAARRPVPIRRGGER